MVANRGGWVVPMWVDGRVCRGMRRMASNRPPAYCILESVGWPLSTMPRTFAVDDGVFGEMEAGFGQTSLAVFAGRPGARCVALLAM